MTISRPPKFPANLKLLSSSDAQDALLTTIFHPVLLSTPDSNKLHLTTFISLLVVRAAKDASGEAMLKQWLQSWYARGDNDGVTFDAGPYSNVGRVVCTRKSIFPNRIALELPHS